MESFFIQINGLTKSYQGHTILSSVSLSLPSHGLFLLKGENGSGKSTLLSILAGKDRDYQGTLFVNGKKIEKKDADKYSDSYVSYVPQDSLVFEDEKAIDDFLLPFGKKDRAKAEEILSSLGLASVRDEKCSELSEGEKERLCFGQALFRNRPILLLDEITANLDSQSQDILLRKILEVSKDRLVVFATHEGLPSYFEEEANVLLLEKGTLSFSKPRKEADALSTPAKPVKGAFTLSKKDRGLSFLVGCICLIRSALSLVRMSLSFSFNNSKNLTLLDDLASKVYVQTSPVLIKSGTTTNPNDFPSLSNKVNNLAPLSGKEAGSCFSGLFVLGKDNGLKPRLISGTYPEKSDEVIISDVCQRQKSDAAIGSRIFLFDKQYTISGIYKAEHTDFVNQRYAGKKDEQSYDSFIRVCYAFKTETVFAGYESLNSYDSFAVLNDDTSKTEYLETDSYLKPTFILLDNMDSTYSPILVNRKGKYRFGFLSGYMGTRVFGILAVVCLLVFLVIFSLSLYTKNKRRYLLLRYRGVSRKKLISGNLIRFLIAYLLGRTSGIGIGEIILLSENCYLNAELGTAGIGFVFSWYWTYLILLGVLVVFRLSLAYIRCVLLCPKDRTKHREEVKKK